MGAPKHTEPSAANLSVYNTMREFKAKTGFVPTASEVAAILGLTKPGVQYHLTKLEAYGLIERKLEVSPRITFRED